MAEVGSSPNILWLPHVDNPGVCLRKSSSNRFGAVERRVVRNDDLDVGMRLPEQIMHRQFEARRLVVHRNTDTHERIAFVLRRSGVFAHGATDHDGRAPRIAFQTRGAVKGMSRCSIPWWLGESMTAF